MCLVIPILPSSLGSFLQSPVPFLVGMHRSFRDEIRASDDVVLIDLDRNEIIAPTGHEEDIKYVFYIAIF